ncbi:hypothetical protein pdam_00025890, partial [Pocillopora damicornis]
ISAQSVKHSIVKHSKVESSSSSLVAAHRKRKRKSTGISAQSVKHSVVKHPNAKSSSHSLLTAPRKKICQSAVCILLLHVYVWKKLFLLQKGWHYIYQTSFTPSYNVPHYNWVGRE